MLLSFSHIPNKIRERKLGYGRPEINRKYSEIWPNISEKKEPPADAEEWQNVEDKFNKHFSEKPGR